MKKETGTYPSSNGRDTIAYYVYRPEGEPCAVLQISHGMCDYIERYEPFAEFLTEKGFVVCGNDHLGHGNSAGGPEDLGYFAEEKGWICLVKDMRRLTFLMKQELPGVPYFLLGHSMGSLASRVYIAKFGQELSGCILMGTCGKSPSSSMIAQVARMQRRQKGDRYRSSWIHSMAFGAYNARVKEHRSDYDWISTDNEVVDRFCEDPKCNFTFTLSAFFDLYALEQYVGRKGWAKEVPSTLPIYLVSGDMDPVGSYGKGVREVFKALNSAGGQDVSLKLYGSDRHELLNETDRDRVYDDLLHWMNKRR